ncbi:uncharacterized protein LOC120284111 [Dioscorea cayenensis subsp. rotundata]|uniref:Uncharacterized protein LOC120284111 n=1 Tax=Dioscorea cayennensis subsp. rotundata TaxID=55577 RepID=A0AB40D917_DIOCR|nr:uncharacterized protein LOC120284111 [Dioscorea cayenensis subsp. rotundata]
MRPMPISSSCGSSDHDVTMVGQRYEDAKHFKEVLCDFAIKCNFNFHFIKNDKDRVTIVCTAGGCPWRVHASREGNLATFKIKTSQGGHTCGGGIATASHPKASKRWVCKQVLNKLRDYPLYQVVDIQRDILRDHDVHLQYKQAWMGKEMLREVLHGSDIANCDLLLLYAAAGKVAKTNQGSIVKIDWDGERFKHGFFCFHASLDGFRKGCRPLLFLDGIHFLGRYGGILLGTIGKDGNEGFFHLAFAIVDNETNENWTWFISTLGDALYGKKNYNKIITFISDKSKGLINAIVRVFPSSPHGYYL